MHHNIGNFVLLVPLILYSLNVHYLYKNLLAIATKLKRIQNETNFSFNPIYTP